MNLGRSPVGVFFRHAPDQHTNLFGNVRSATPWPGTPTPIEPETGAMPPYDGLGLHDDEDVGPTGRKAAGSGPEESVQPVQRWPRPFTLEHGKLLAEGEDIGRLGGRLCPTWSSQRQNDEGKLPISQHDWMLTCSGTVGGAALSVNSGVDDPGPVS